MSEAMQDGPVTVKSELANIRAELQDVRQTTNEIRRALLGDLGGYSGLINRVGAVESRISMLEIKEGDLYKEHRRTMEEIEARVAANKEWIDSIKNRAIGIGIGLSLGSAGIGALVGALIP
jgi:hypothetical protein